MAEKSRDGSPPGRRSFSFIGDISSARSLGLLEIDKNNWPVTKLISHLFNLSLQRFSERCYWLVWNLKIEIYKRDLNPSKSCFWVQTLQSFLNTYPKLKLKPSDSLLRTLDGTVPPTDLPTNQEIMDLITQNRKPGVEWILTFWNLQNCRFQIYL